MISEGEDSINYAVKESSMVYFEQQNRTKNQLMISTNIQNVYSCKKNKLSEITDLKLTSLTEIMKKRKQINFNSGLVQNLPEIESNEGNDRYWFHTQKQKICRLYYLVLNNSSLNKWG